MIAWTSSSNYMDGGEFGLFRAVCTDGLLTWFTPYLFWVSLPGEMIVGKHLPVAVAEDRDSRPKHEIDRPLLHLHLTGPGCPGGWQKRVHSPGVNRKQAVFGSLCYGRGLFFYHVQPRKTAWGAQILLQELVRRARRTGRRIVVVMDQDTPHHANAAAR
jgi:hypothetical protein